MQVRLLLVHSPLVGSGTWGPVATDLAGAGYAVVVADLAETAAGGPPYHLRQAQAIAAAAGDQPVILIGHSRAGPLLPSAGTMLGDSVLGYVFVDSRLPAPGCSWLDTVPAFATRLRDLADPDGWLPPWSRWWADEELAALFPDPAVRQHFAAGCPRLPMAMLEEVYPPVPGWPDAPCSYLQLSDEYAGDAARARRLGWRVIHQPSHHLALLTDPEQVARELRQLVGQP
ncbi:MAG TPA: alpha/beta hydrolase [Streptosporangiaceae bacterium]|jgi:pimeloyl-ACP methyl ester carboxylesterase